MNKEVYKPEIVPDHELRRVSFLNRRASIQKSIREPKYLGKEREKILRHGRQAGRGVSQSCLLICFVSSSYFPP